MTSHLALFVSLFISLVFFVSARPGIYRQDVIDGEDCDWPWCKFCPNEYLGLLCKLCPQKYTPAYPHVTTPAVEEATTEVAPPVTEMPKFQAFESLDFPWCKFCNETDLGFLCKLCNCTFGKPASTAAPEMPSEKPSVPEKEALKVRHVGASKQEIINGLQDCDWPWCKFCPNERLGFLCKLCPAKTTPAQSEATTPVNANPSEQSSRAPETNSPKIEIAENFTFPWCKFCGEFDLGFLCKLCNCTFGKPGSTPAPVQPTEKPTEASETEAPIKSELKLQVFQLENNGISQNFRKQLSKEKITRMNKIQEVAQ